MVARYIDRYGSASKKALLNHIVLFMLHARPDIRYTLYVVSTYLTYFKRRLILYNNFTYSLSQVKAGLNDSIQASNKKVPIYHQATI